MPSWRVVTAVGLRSPLSGRAHTVWPLPTSPSVYSRNLPSGDQSLGIGLPLLLSRVSTSPLPFDRFRSIGTKLADGAPPKAIHSPSGDQAGNWFCPLKVSLVLTFRARS